MTSYGDENGDIVAELQGNNTGTAARKVWS